MQVPEIIGYTLIEQIGEGGTATVWRGRRNGEDCDLAIKIVSPDHADPSMLDRALQEGRVCWSIPTRRVPEQAPTGSSVAALRAATAVLRPVPTVCPTVATTTSGSAWSDADKSTRWWT